MKNPSNWRELDYYKSIVNIKKNNDITELTDLYFNFTNQKKDLSSKALLKKVAKDKDAKIGCKGSDKFWYGYKKHISFDMQSVLINKVAVTPANITDSQGFKYLCPNVRAVYADKPYCAKLSSNKICSSMPAQEKEYDG